MALPIVAGTGNLLDGSSQRHLCHFTLGFRLGPAAPSGREGALGKCLSCGGCSLACVGLRAPSLPTPRRPSKKPQLPTRLEACTVGQCSPTVTPWGTVRAEL